MKWYEILISVLTGLATAIPLVVELVKYVKKAIQEKNWNSLLTLVTNLMQEAESKFDNGADRKEWVLTCIKATSDTINYPIDIKQVGELIDSLCAMTKVVNPPIIEQKIEK